jgi:hypothetical protein
MGTDLIECHQSRTEQLVFLSISFFSYPYMSLFFRPILYCFFWFKVSSKKAPYRPCKKKLSGFLADISDNDLLPEKKPVQVFGSAFTLLAFFLYDMLILGYPLTILSSSNVRLLICST